MDETFWKLLSNSFPTIADRGADRISCFCDGDLKICVAVIVTIDTAGEKLPLWAIAEGKTERCQNAIHDSCARQVEQKN
jgi:hypothetical protein